MTGVRFVIPRTVLRYGSLALGFFLACFLSLAIVGAVTGDAVATAVLSPLVVLAIGWYFFKAVRRGA